MTADVRYPIGRFDHATPVTAAMHQPAIAAIAELPARMRDAVSGLSDAQADMPYRPGGWTVRQLVHHVADSHANGYIRLKLGLTEEQPTILQMYAWHARHHVAHITSLRQREGWLAKP